MSIAVVKLGVGNTASVMYALGRLGANAVLTSDAARIADAERVILPGVGAAAHAMGRIDALGLREHLAKFPRPLLGICLGTTNIVRKQRRGASEMPGRICGRC